MGDGGETRAGTKHRRPVGPLLALAIALALVELGPRAALAQAPASTAVPDEEVAAETPDEPEETPGFFRRHLLRLPAQVRFTFDRGDPDQAADRNTGRRPTRSDGASDGPFHAPAGVPFGLADLVLQPEGAAYALDLGLFASGGEQPDTGGRLGLRFEF